MADGQEWMAEDVNIKTEPSFCCDDSNPTAVGWLPLHVGIRTSRLRVIGRTDGDCLPTRNGDAWQGYGEVSTDSEDKGRNALKALISGGSTGFAVVGGSRSVAAQLMASTRIGSAWVLWTASEINHRLRMVLQPRQRRPSAQSAKRR